MNKTTGWKSGPANEVPLWCVFGWIERDRGRVVWNESRVYRVEQDAQQGSTVTLLLNNGRRFPFPATQTVYYQLG